MPHRRPTTRDSNQRESTRAEPVARGPTGPAWFPFEAREKDDPRSYVTDPQLDYGAVRPIPPAAGADPRSGSSG